MSKTVILVVEDQPDIRKLIRLTLDLGDYGRKLASSWSAKPQFRRQQQQVQHAPPRRGWLNSRHCAKLRALRTGTYEKRAMKVVILISGRGSNMQALLEARLPVEYACVISNKADARGLEIAAAHGIPTCVLSHRDYPDRASYDTALAAEIDRHAPDLVILAGFMRVLTAAFVLHYQGRLINIHPALLPAFPGLDTHARALAAGVKLHGCTVHFVTPEVDAGPILAQAAVPVLPDDTADTLAARVLAQEHRLFPEAIRWIAQGRLVWREDGTVYARDLAVAGRAEARAPSEIG